MKTIQFNCNCCGKQHTKTLKEHKRQQRRGQTKYYCSTSCASRHSRTDSLSPFRPILSAAKRTAKVNQHEYDLDLEYLKQLWDTQQGVCPYTKIEMIQQTHGHHTLKTASLDRIESSKGYIKGNVEFVCLFVNFGKNKFLKEDVIQFFSTVITKVKETTYTAP